MSKDIDKSSYPGGLYAGPYRMDRTQFWKFSLLDALTGAEQDAARTRFGRRDSQSRA
jgi:hypothetical protein